MTHLVKLRASLKEKAAADNTIAGVLKGLLEKDDLTKEDIDTLKAKTAEKEALNADIVKLNEEIEMIEAAERNKAAYSIPANTATGAAPAAAKQTLDNKEKVGLLLTAGLKTYREVKHCSERAVYDVLEKDGYGALADEFFSSTKGVVSTTGSAGGLTVPPDFNETILDMLTPMSAFLRGNPQRIPLVNGNYRQSGLLARPTVAYRAEAAAGTVSSPTFRDFSLAAKHLTGITPISNEIIKWTGNRASAIAQRALTSAIGLKMDSALLLGTGASDTPIGIFAISGITSFAATNSVAPTVVQIDADVRKLLNVVESYGELQAGLAWVMPQRVKGYLQDLRLVVGSDSGPKAYPEVEKGFFKGYPILTSAQMPINGGAGTNEATIGLVSFGTVLFGDSDGVGIAFSEEAAVGGVSMFETNQTAMRVTASHDTNIQYAESVGKLTAVKWGA